MTRREIRALREDELEAYIDIVVFAYPGMRAFGPDDRERLRERASAARARGDTTFHGVFDDGLLVGVMCMHDFKMQLLTARTLAGGVGQVAVDLRHKRRRVALDMVRAFVAHYRERGAPIAALYPFRHDFYRRMGFGYGAAVRSYRIDPEALPDVRDGVGLDDLGSDDLAAVSGAYDREMLRTNGLFERPDHVWQQLLREPRLRVVGIRNAAEIGGYLIAQLEPTSPDNFLRQDLVVREVVYDTPPDLLRLLAFLRTQADQVERIVLNAVDDVWPFLLSDPRDGSGRMLPKAVCHQVGSVGLGVMYRVLDVRRLFRVLSGHPFGSETVRLGLSIEDSLVPENAVPLRVCFQDGIMVGIDDEAGEADVTLTLDVAEFSSMIVGAVRLESLLRVGLATVSEPTWSGRLDRLFAAPPPRCWTDF